MSGIEVAGLVLGAFPLLISALEHLVKLRRFRRECQKDLNRLQDIQLVYRESMRTLLVPLQYDGTLDATQIELLLDDPSSQGWSDSDVQDEVSRRLGNFKDSYFQGLQDMNRTILKLAKESKVDDDRFQSSLHTNKVEQLSACTVLSRYAKPLRQDPVTRGTLLRINERFLLELNRVSYTFTHSKRGALIEEIDAGTRRLDKFLSLQDGMLRHAPTPFPSTRGKDRKKYARLVVFWQHANRIFRLMHSAWRCSCVPLHCVHIPVHQAIASTPVSLEILLKYSSDVNAAQQCLWRPVPLSIDHFELLTNAAGIMPAKLKRSVRFDQADSSAGASFTGGTADVVATTSGSSTIQLRCTAGTLPETSPEASSPGSILPGVLSTAPDQGLCHIARKSQTAVLGSHIHTLSDEATNDAYKLFTATTAIHDGLIYSLTDILRGQCALELYHGPRLSIAHAIAVSFLQFYTTPWLNESEMSTSICIPVSADGKRLLHEHAFVSSHFHHDPEPDDRVFTLFGILLLELCYNKPLEEHQIFKLRPESKADPLVRNAVATEWAKDVEYQWREEGARAIGWCLHNASSRNEGWRMKFATNVVEPLKVLCDQAGLSQSGGLAATCI
jgi:hypothetical protein